LFVAFARKILPAICARANTTDNARARAKRAIALNLYLTIASEAPRAVPGAPNTLTTGESRLREAHTTN
jgi:predicted RNase H-like HicB family nuclease